MEEVWKDIPDYEGLYQVSNLGRVKSLSRKVWNGLGFYTTNEKLMKPSKRNYKYYFINLRKDNKTKPKTIHRLVAICFLNYDPEKTNKIIDHIDNNSTNNNVDNLQIITRRENNSKDKKNKTSKYTGVSYDNGRKKWCASIKVKTKSYNLGRYDNEYDAHLAYQKALSRLNE